MIVHVYFSDPSWETALLVNHEQLEAFLLTEKNRFPSLHPGVRMVLQNGYFEVKEDYSLIEIFPTDQEVQGDGATSAVWINLYP